jgi:hypothetical protein
LAVRLLRFEYKDTVALYSTRNRPCEAHKRLNRGHGGDGKDQKGSGRSHRVTESQRDEGQGVKQGNTRVRLSRDRVDTRRPKEDQRSKQCQDTIGKMVREDEPGHRCSDRLEQVSKGVKPRGTM